MGSGPLSVNPSPNCTNRGEFVGGGGGHREENVSTTVLGGT